MHTRRSPIGRAARGLALAALLALTALPRLQAQTPAPAAPAASADITAGKMLPDDRPRPPGQLTATEIMERMVVACGGREANAKVTTTAITGTVTVRRGDTLTDGTFTGYSKAPNQALKVFVIPGLGTQRQGFDGRRGWSMGASGQVRWLEGAELAHQTLVAQFNCLVNYAQNFVKVELLDATTLDDQPVYQIRLTPKDTDAQTLYIARDSFLLQAVDQVNHTAAGPLPVRVRYRDYRRVGDILIAYQIWAEMGGQHTLIKFEQVRLDERLDDGIFSPPAEAAPAPAPTPAPPPAPKPRPQPMPLPQQTPGD